MRRSLTTTILTLSIFLTAAASPAQDRAHKLANQAKGVKAVPCVAKDSDTMEECHRNYPSGCTEAAQYDPFLGFLKNQTPAPGSKPLRNINTVDLKFLEKKVPAGLHSKNLKEHAVYLADYGQGNVYSVVAYLYYSQVTKGAEACNCKLTGEPNSDFHIGIGFDAKVAERLRGGEKVEKKFLDQTSMIVEMSPHYRAEHHPEWTNDLVKSHVGRQVKVVGQLLLDGA